MTGLKMESMMKVLRKDGKRKKEPMRKNGIGG